MNLQTNEGNSMGKNTPCVVKEEGRIPKADRIQSTLVSRRSKQGDWPKELRNTAPWRAFLRVDGRHESLNLTARGQCKDLERR